MSETAWKLARRAEPRLLVQRLSALERYGDWDWVHSWASCLLLLLHSYRGEVGAAAEEARSRRVVVVGGRMQFVVCGDGFDPLMLAELGGGLGVGFGRESCDLIPVVGMVIDGVAGVGGSIDTCLVGNGLGMEV